MIKKYRKKPVEIEALIWDGENISEVDKFVVGQGLILKFGGVMNHKDLVIETLEGEHIASIGDYIIEGVKGEFYPCKPDIFKLTYDSVD